MTKATDTVSVSPIARFLLKVEKGLRFAVLGTVAAVRGLFLAPLIISRHAQLST